MSGIGEPAAKATSKSFDWSTGSTVMTGAESKTYRFSGVIPVPITVDAGWVVMSPFQRAVRPLSRPGSGTSSGVGA